jgi:hypothetical protein
MSKITLCFHPVKELSVLFYSAPLQDTSPLFGVCCSGSSLTVVNLEITFKMNVI